MENQWEIDYPINNDSVVYTTTLQKKRWFLYLQLFICVFLFIIRKKRIPRKISFYIPSPGHSEDLSNNFIYFFQWPFIFVWKSWSLRLFLLTIFSEVGRMSVRYMKINMTVSCVSRTFLDSIMVLESFGTQVIKFLTIFFFSSKIMFWNYNLINSYGNV